MASLSVLDRKNVSSDRVNQMQKLAWAERVFDKVFSSPQGLMKLASALSNPVRKQLDYKGITRNFTVTELLPIGMPAVFDRDMRFMGASSVSNCAVGANGAVREINVNVDRVQLGDGFEIGIVPQVNWRQTFIRRYDVVKRIGDRLIEGIQQKEDLVWLSYLETAGTLYGGTERKHPNGNVQINLTGKLTKTALADAFAQIDDRRLPVRYVLGDAYMRASIQSWTFQEMDQAGMQELRETGYLGDMWGANFFFSDQLSLSTGSGKGVCYVLTDSQFLSWTPLRCEMQIVPADKPWEFTMGFAGWELLNMIVHNNWGVVKITYDKTTY